MRPLGTQHTAKARPKPRALGEGRGKTSGTEVNARVLGSALLG